MPSDIAEVLASCAFFSQVERASRTRLTRMAVRREFQKGEVIFREGDAGDGLFIVVKGSVRISKQSATGEEALAVLEPHAFFGEMALIDFSPRAADAIANEALDLFFIPLKELRTLIETNHQIAMKVLYALCEALAQRLRETNERYMSVFTIAQWGGSSQNGLIPLP